MEQQAHNLGVLGDALAAILKPIVEGAVKEAINGHKDEDRLLDAEEVAKILGVDTGYVYSQARAKKIPSIKLGKYRKFSPSQLKKWLDRKNNA